MNERYYTRLLYSAVCGALLKNNCDCELPKNCEEAIALCENVGVKAHYFKRSNLLPRVKKVLGFLTSVSPVSLLDVGSGRGAFLFPFLEEFPYSKVTSIDILPHRVELMENIANGGVKNLTAFNDDICTYSAPDNSFEVVTLLEVLEHIPNVEKAISNAVRLASKYVVVTVPAEEDDNPEHIRLLTKEILTDYFNARGVSRLSFEGVPGHLVMIARI
ncbi:MAG: class I SAM-dependent methyltransferase [Clostridia bacterium]|nr:class I SAM-dependent methyltransferase [Clostridia bacterium]